jgi:hypothetical protein
MFVIQILSQPQVRTRRPKVKIKILAAQGVARLLTALLHGRYHTEPDQFVKTYGERKNAWKWQHGGQTLARQLEAII